MWVGKAAPPKPTIPDFAIISIISFEEALISLTILGDLSIDSSHTSPSTFITIWGIRFPEISGIGSTAVTVPETEE